MKTTKWSETAPKTILWLGLLVAFFATRPATAATWEQKTPAQAGASVDIAPWGERTSWENGKDVGVYWEDPRDVTKVVVVFADAPPDPQVARLQWWQSQWPERRIPRDHLSGAGGSGWLDVGDWYRGRWRTADCRFSSSGNSWIFTFRRVNQTEFPQLKDFPATYRTTMKVRLLFDMRAPKIASFQVFSDSVWKDSEMALEWGGSAKNPQNWDGHLEVFNGWVERIEPLKPDTQVDIRNDGTWSSTVQNRTDGIRARIWYTQSSNINTYDKTIVTVRARQQSFSVDAQSVAQGTNIFVPAFGVLVHRADISDTFAEALARWQSRTDKTIFEKVFDEPEQTYSHARSEMPPKRQFYIPLGCEGGRQRFGADPDGSIFCRNDRIDTPAGKDTRRRIWGGDSLRYRFGLPSGTPDQRWIEDGCLPIIHAQWERGGIRYTQTAFATRLDTGVPGWPDMQADDTTVLMMKIECENVRDLATDVNLDFSLDADNHPVPLSVRGDVVYANLQPKPVVRYVCTTSPGSRIAQHDARLRFSATLAPGAREFVIAAVPFITLDQAGELERLKAMSYTDELARIATFWRSRADMGAQIHTPVNDITDFYRADVSHLMINCGREVGADRLMARVGSFSYGVYGNESCMMITDLDRRGYHREAERCLETFLHYQGTSDLPGDYDSQAGVFNGAGAWESGGYNQHHGWILWAMAEHYWYTGDRAWLQRNADKFIAACQWIIQQRQRTCHFPPHSLRSIEYGLLPPGSLEDIGDWRCWLSNNGFSWWGLDSMAHALTDIEHPAAQQLQAEADAYRKDISTAFGEAMVRSPLVGLRDGRFIPAIPSDVHRRGRSYGWITTTLEGPIYLIRIGAIDPNGPTARWTMEDYEDNFYLSEQFGYSPRHLAHWFSQGGFSMQPNLLCSPHPYLMRDEIKHYLRAYFNAFAVGFYANTRMLTEHPLEEMGDWRGDHYKSSDESNSTYWLRLMFIDERADDLYLGMAIPRAWLRDGCDPSIDHASTHFGNMSVRFNSHADAGYIEAVVDPPQRRAPKHTYLRFRHPDGKAIQHVTVNGRDWTQFDAKKELIELPTGTERMVIKATY